VGSKREELSHERRREAEVAGQGWAEQGWAVAPWREGWWQARCPWSWWAGLSRGCPAAEGCPEDPKKMGGQSYLACGTPPAGRRRRKKLPKKEAAAADLGKGCNGLRTERGQVAPYKE